MTRDLLLPLLAIVILANAGVIAYVIGHQRGREREPARPLTEGRLAAPTAAFAARPPAALAPAAGSRDDPLAPTATAAARPPTALAPAVDSIGPERARPAAPPPWG
jgi:hypothetical protein